MCVCVVDCVCLLCVFGCLLVGGFTYWFGCFVRCVFVCHVVVGLLVCLLVYSYVGLLRCLRVWLVACLFDGLCVCLLY